MDEPSAAHPSSDELNQIELNPDLFPHLLHPDPNEAAWQRLSESIFIDFDWTRLIGALDQIGKATGLRVFVEWPSLAEVGIDQDAPVFLKARNVSGVDALRLVLDQMGGFATEPLAYTIVSGTVIIGTYVSVLRHTEVRVYDIRDLLRPFDPIQPCSQETRDQLLCKLLDTMADNLGRRDDWPHYDGLVNRANEFNGTLVVTASPLVHNQIIGLFDRLRRIARNSPFSASPAKAGIVKIEARPPEDSSGEKPRESITWREAQELLVEGMSRGDAFASRDKLAGRLATSTQKSCVASTVQKAFQPSHSALNRLSATEGARAKDLARRLKEWESSSRPTSPRATGINEVILDSVPVTTTDPSNRLPDDEVESTLTKLKAEAVARGKEEEVKNIESMNAEERRALAEAFHSQGLDSEPSPLDDDPPGRRPRTVNSYKRP